MGVRIKNSLSQVMTLTFVLMTGLLFQNCSETKRSIPQDGASSSSSSSSVLDVADWEWTDPGNVDPANPNVQTRSRIYDVSVSQEAVFNGSMYTSIVWSHVEESITYFGGLYKIMINGERCGASREQKEIGGSGGHRLMGESSCIKVLSPGIYTIEFISRGWTNRTDFHPEFAAGHLGYSVIAK